jgi:hypothetical protein
MNLLIRSTRSFFVLRTRPLKGLALAALLVLSGCPTEEEKAAGPSEQGTDQTPDHTHRWDDQKGQTPTPPNSSDAAGNGTAEGTLGAPGEGAPGGAAEPTIVHAELGPEDLVRHYLMLGSAGDLSRIADYVDPRCFKGPVGRVDAVRVVGTLMTLEGLTLALESQTDTNAVVNYHMIGGITAGEKKTEISIEGEELAERTAILTTAGIERRGWLKLTSVDRLWRVTCAFSYAPPADPLGFAP